MKLPTAQEINIDNSLDGIEACKDFLGKTLEEAELLFRKSPMRYQEDLMWMGPRAFAFYIQAAANYIKSDFANEDSDFVSALYVDIEFHLKDAEFSLASDCVIDIADYVICNYSKFAMIYEVYGDYKSKYVKLRNHLLNIKKLPKEQQIYGYSFPNGINDCKHSQEETLEESKRMQKEGLAYIESLMRIEPKGFVSYIQLVESYIELATIDIQFATDYFDGDFVISLYVNIESHFKDAEFPLDSVIEITDFVISNYSKFNMTDEKYGDVKSKYIKLRDDLVNRA
ncbi:MAG: hypothetical protein JEZ07_19720 [Phycisphaerae bacterium]|nr:hypothetical protein [Phycisphaerae bacterium]